MKLPIISRVKTARARLSKLTYRMPDKPYRHIVNGGPARCVPYGPDARPCSCPAVTRAGLEESAGSPGSTSVATPAHDATVTRAEAYLREQF